MSDSISTKGMLNLIVVYLVWGSTYLFIRLTVQEGSGFPPLSLSGSPVFFGNGSDREGGDIEKRKYMEMGSQFKVLSILKGRLLRNDRQGMRLEIP